MNPSKRIGSLLPRSMSLRWKIVAWFLVPTLILMTNVAIVNYFAYRSVTEDLVLERDKDLVRLSAVQLSSSFRDYEDRLSNVARDAGLTTSASDAKPGVLASMSGPLAVFDGGTLLLARNGSVVDSYPQDEGITGTRWGSPQLMAELLRTSHPVYSDVVQTSSANVVAVIVPIISPGGALEGAIAGMFKLGEPAVSAFYGGIVRLRLARGGSVYVTDSDGTVIYHTDPDQVGQDLSEHLPVTQALAGNTNALRTNGLDGEEVSAAFAPVPGTTWRLMTEENWAALSAEANSFQRWIVFVLVADVLVASLIAGIGLKRLMGPVNELKRAAVAVGGGEYGRQVEVKSEDEVGQLAASFNQMSNDLKESYETLEHRIQEREQELRASEMRYTDLFENAVEGIVFVRDSHFLDVNRAACEILGAPREEIIGQPVEKWLTDSDLESWHILRNRLLQAGGQVEDFRIGLVRPDGTRAVAYVTARRRPEVGGAVEAFIRDVTARLQTEEELFEQTRELAVTDERNRMAREIHDTIAQGLTGIVLQLEAAEDSFDGVKREAKTHVDRAKTLARESLAEARRSVWNLTPAALEERTLSQALSEEVEKFSARGMERAIFEVEGAPVEVARETEVALLRICQEALMNARKYAGASTIEVRLRYWPGEIVLTVKDDGHGFDPEAVSASDQGGFGLSSMRRRAHVEGGTLEVESTSEDGTTITTRIPF